MQLRRLLLFLLIVTAATMALAQPADTLGVSQDSTRIQVPTPFPPDTSAALADTAAAARSAKADTLTWRERHSPRKATIFSAVVPGAGQIYNRKYWKAPIVWIGLGISYTFIRDNTLEYQRYRTAYLALVDDDPDTMDEFDGRYSPAQVRQVMETYQRWRDISYIAIAGVYILNIIDASVDAHFVRFDVSPDLTLNMGPSLPAAAHGAVGISLQLALK